MMRPLLVLYALLMLTGSAGAAERGAILIVNDPHAATAPDVDSPSHPVDLQAGAWLPVVESRGSGAEGLFDPDHWTSATARAWYRVRLPAGSGLPDQASAFLPAAHLAPAGPILLPGQAPDLDAERVDRWHGLPPSHAPDDLVSVGPRYNDEIDYQLRPEPAAALKRLVKAARADGIWLYVISAYRPWEKQQSIYQAKLNRDGWYQDTVAKPGHSEHQLGTTVDFTDGELETQLRPAFGKTKAGRWLCEHAPAFGFAQSYTEANRHLTGYAPEPWHYRYWGPERAPEVHRRAHAGEPMVDEAPAAMP